MALPGGYSGIGSVDMPLRIGNAEVLAQLAKFTNENMLMGNGVAYADLYYMLTSDIELGGFGNWTPIGNSSNPFTGTFDYNTGGIVGEGASILVISNCFSTAAVNGDFSGGILSATGTLSCCYATDPIKATGTACGIGNGVRVKGRSTSFSGSSCTTK